MMEWAVVYTTTDGESVDLADPACNYSDVSADAALKRSGSAHEELVRDGASWCGVCGAVGPDSDVQWHPEGWLDDAVPCALCNRLVSGRCAHRHQGLWIGDECCWDERLRSSE